jgi:cytochrome P450
VLELICEVLLGQAALGTPLVADIARMMRFANLPFHFQLFKVPLPGSPWARFLAARRRADRALYQEIARRRHTGVLGDDVLGLLLAAQDEHGQGLSDPEVRDQALSLVSAGFDTTAAALTWAVAELLGQPALLARLKDELRAAAEPPLLGHVIKETLRLYPPTPAGLRQTSCDLEFAGYRIPKGHRVAFSIYAAHRLKGVYPDPLAFRPERWETFTPPPYSYLPFGSGARYCIGAGLATRTLTLGLSSLVRGFDLTPAWPEPLLEAGNTLHPRGGLRVEVAASARG